uniref:hypothetical protein n=1 Tax=Castellaniella defragrans TaxID=75697 RepID=UPI003342E0CF
MKPMTLLACTLAFATLYSSPLLAKEHTHGHHKERAHSHHTRQSPSQTQQTSSFDSGMQPVIHSAAVGEPGQGWRYFSDPAHARAIMISPDGQYYLSRGKGPQWVANSRN